MPYSSSIQIVNDANGTAHAFLADNGLLWQCQWNAEAQRWDRGLQVPGAYGARDLQALVVDNLWPSSGISGKVPGNAQGIVLAYRLGNGASSQVMASFGEWGSDGSLSWTEAVPLSNSQGDDEAFALVPSGAGTLRVVLQKREAESSPQELLATFAQAPAAQVSQMLADLASGARGDSDLYVSNLQITPGANGSYAAELSGNGQSLSTALTQAAAAPAVATPAVAFAGNTQLSRAVLAANAAPSTSPMLLMSSGGGTPMLLSASAPSTEPVAFAQQGSEQANTQGFGFTRYVQNPLALTSLALFPVRYALSLLAKKQGDEAKAKGFFDNNLSDTSYFETESDFSESLVEELSQGPLSEIPRGAIVPDSLDTTRRVSNGVMLNNEKLENVVEVRDVTSSVTSGVARPSVTEPPTAGSPKDLVLSGFFGGLLAGRGGYTVVNFSRLALSTGDVFQNFEDDVPGYFSRANNAGPFTSGNIAWAFGGRVATVFQYDSPSSSSATKLIGFAAQESIGISSLLHSIKIRPSSTLILDASASLSLLFQQRYAAAEGLSRSLGITGLATGALGNILQQVGNSKGIYDRLKAPETGIGETVDITFRGGLGSTIGGFNKFNNTIGIGSAALAIGSVVGVASSGMRDKGSASTGVGVQLATKVSMLSKWGVGLGLRAAFQENALWTYRTAGNGAGTGPAPGAQTLFFGSVGASIIGGGFVPLFSMSYASNTKSSSPAPEPSPAPQPSPDSEPLLQAAAPAPQSQGFLVEAPTGARYPFVYAPASASDALLTTVNGPLASLTNRPNRLEWHQLSSFKAAELKSGLLNWANPGADLTDGSYQNVVLIGPGLPDSAKATASFRVVNGAVDPTSLEVQGSRSLSLPGWIADGVLTLEAAADPNLQSGDTVSADGLAEPLLITGLLAPYDPTTQRASYRLSQPASLAAAAAPTTFEITTAKGQYLALPEAGSGRYVFALNIFQQEPGNPAPPNPASAASAASVFSALPLFSLETSIGSNGSPLQSRQIQRIQQELPIRDLSQGGPYPKADGTTPDPGDYNAYTYLNVPVALLRTDGSGLPIQPFNPDVTATIKLSAGNIINIKLDQPLYFSKPTELAGSNSYQLVLDIAGRLGNASLSNPTLLVNSQVESLVDFSDQDSFSPNPTATNAGVYIAAGLSDQLALLPSFARFPVQNRVAYVDGNTIVYLNNTGGDRGRGQAVSSSNLNPENLYNNPDNFNFTFASNPTAITDTASKTTYVFWVEAAQPVIPFTSGDGEANFQAFMNAIYGNQRIGYSYATTSQSGTNTTWNYVNAADLYASPGNIITDLRSFSVQVAGEQRSLLVWTEVPISALKTAQANPNALFDHQLAVIKVGLINAQASQIPGGYQWEQLFSDANGNSTISTIPWTSDRGSGLSIADLSAATLPVQLEPVARFSGGIFGTTLTVSQLSAGSLKPGDLILGAGVLPGTTITSVVTAATASSPGTYRVSQSHTVASTNLLAVPFSDASQTYSSGTAFTASFSGEGNTTLNVASGLSIALQVGDQLLGVGLEPGTFITAVQAFDPASGAGRFLINRGPATASGSTALLAVPEGTPLPPASQTLLTPVLSWSEAVRTPYNQTVLNSEPLLFLRLGALEPGVNNLNIGSSGYNTETFASDTGLNTSIAGALPKSSASAVQNVEGLGVLSTGLGTFNAQTLEILRNTPQEPANPAASPVAVFSATIDGSILTVSSLSLGTLAVGELLVGDGVAAGTTISEVLTAATTTSPGSYRLSRPSSLPAATTLRTLPTDSQLPLLSFSGSFSGTGGANGYTTLTISQLSGGTLRVGDRVYGLGVSGGSTIEQVQSLDLNSGTAVVTLSQGPQTAGGSYALASSPGGSSSPYTIEFWTKLSRDSNPAGAGLVALGQPSATALPDRPLELPKGWLLSSSFLVERLSWQDAMEQSLVASTPDGTNPTDLYGWNWSLRADGTNTRAMNGNGGSNLYRNALLLDNLLVGDTIEGVNTFLGNYGLSTADLPGLDGTPVDQIALAPSTAFEFSTALQVNPAVGQTVANTSLNGIAIDTSTAVMNTGLVLASQANTNLSSMLDSVWEFQEKTGGPKVLFSLDPTTQTTPPPPSQPARTRIEQYGGYALNFALGFGPAVSVNGNGQIAFDVAPGQTLISAADIDYRDESWHYVVASFLPEFITYSSDEGLLDLPRNVGTANLYIDGRLVSSQASVIDPFSPNNNNDQAQLLSDNSGGALDLLALYNTALTTSQPPAVASDWPVPTSAAALDLIKEAGFVIASKTPNPGEQPGAVSNHWLARTVDPNNAVNNTFTSVLLPDAKGGLSWSEASNINPQLAISPTQPSASNASLQEQLLITINAGDWSKQAWYFNNATKAEAFNPAGRTLEAITVTLTPPTSSGGTVLTRTLTPEQVLLGTSGTSLQSLAALQLRAQDQNFLYTFLSNKPALNLLISREPQDASDSNSLDPKLTYTTTVSLEFTDGSQVSVNNNPIAPATDSSSSTPPLVGLGLSTSLSSQLKTDALSNSNALATAEVVEQAPLQLKYVNSGVILSSQNSAEDPSPASTFANALVYGYYDNKQTSETNSGWLALSQPSSTNAVSDPAGRVWIQAVGQFKIDPDSKLHVAVSDAKQNPKTWLNALADSNFSPDSPNLPLLNSALYPSSVGGLLIKADATAGWGQNFGDTMLVADVNNDGILDLVISAPQANAGGAVVIVDGSWIAANLNSSTGQRILDLSNPTNYGDVVTVLRPGIATTATDITSNAGFGTALAFQKGSGGAAGTLWIGAPNYLRTLDATNPEASTQPIGALYSYTPAAYPGSWGTATITPLSKPILGSGGTLTSIQPGNSQSTDYWGAQLGTAVAISSTGELAVSAPGVTGSMVYSGTEKAQKTFVEYDRNYKDRLPEGLLNRIQVGGTAIDTPSDVDSTKYTTIATLQADQLTDNQLKFLTKLREMQLVQIASATTLNNQAVQAAAVGAVMRFNNNTNFASLANAVLTPAAVAALNGETYYGPNPYNTLGDSGFGSSITFADLTNTNREQLIIGADKTGGGGVVYMIDPSTTPRDGSLGNRQQLALLAATNLFVAGSSGDDFGNGLVNLGDVNQDGYQDLLIQAYNAASGAGTGSVLFGTDQLSTTASNQGLASMATGLFGKIQFTNGTSDSITILRELGSSGGFTGQGSYGPGDFDADGINDIPLSSGANAKGYLTWGKSYLEAINNLQLERLTSDNGFILEGLASTTEGSLRSIGDFNGDGYGDFFSIKPGNALTTIRIELGANTQEILANAPYNYYTFTVANGTQILPAGDLNGDGMDDIALFFDRNLSSSADGNQGAGSTTGILYGRSSSDLPIGSSLGFLAPVDPTTSAPLESLPGVNVAGGLTDTAPSVIAVGNTLYAAVKGVGSNSTSLWFSQSLDGGNSWDNWTNLSGGSQTFALKPGTSPSLAFSNNRLYLGFVNGTGTLSLSSWDPRSNNPLAWSTPSLLSSSSGSTAFSTSAGLQLVDRGDALGVLWVNGGMVQAASSTTPDTTPATSPWEVVNSRSSLATPALARIGDTTYMAVQGSGDSNIYWTSSVDGGASWAAWRALPNTVTSQKPPSLAVVNGTLYLSYLTVGTQQITISSLTDATANTWSTAYQIPVAPGSGTVQRAQFASLASEAVNGSEQLAVYYVSVDSSNRILKTQSSTPATRNGWSALAEIKFNTTGVQTASGPLTVGQFNGQTYLAYQGGTLANPDKAIYIGTSRSADLNNGSAWAAQRLLDPGQRTGLGLSNTGSGLQLTYSAASQKGLLQLLNLTPQAGSLTLSQASDPALPLPAGLSSNITLLNGVGNGLPNQLFAGLSTSNAVETSLVYSPGVNSSWSTPLALQQLLNNEGVDIAADATPSFTWLGTTAVLAVKQGASINVYAALGGGSSLQLTSSFSPQPGGPAIASAPVITSTDTGLALTYTNSDGSITLQRLNLLNANGTPVAGVQFKDDGSIDVSKANLQWLSTTLDAGTSGISSSLASTPVSVDGTLLLANVRNSTSANTQIWVNAVPNSSDPDSTTWLNTTVQLPDGKGGWAISQQAGAFGVFDPGWQEPNGGLSPWAPSFAELNGVLYSAVRGWNSADNNKQLYWNRSTDNGRTWSPWQQLPGGMTSDRPPTIAAWNGQLYLVYIGQDNAQSLNITKLNNADANQWAPQIPVRAGVSGASNQTAEFATLVNEGNQLALYYVGTGSNELYSTSSTDPYNTGKFSTSTQIKYNNNGGIQTASGPLAATRLNGQTYLAYQGGTYRTGNNLSGPSNQIFLTTGSANDTNWSLLNPVPQPASASHTGVGLTANSKGLLLSYSDVLYGKNVVSVQQGTGSGTSWSFSPYTLLQTPGNSSARYDGANSLYAQTSGEQVLVSTVNPNANEAISNAWVNPTPVLTPAQTGSTLTPVGDLDNDGFADLLLTANNVVANNVDANAETGFNLATGLRVISGAANSSQILANNDNTAPSQSVQLAAPLFRGSSAKPVSSITGADPANGNLNLEISARSGAIGSVINATVSAGNLTTASGSVAEASALLSGLKPSTAALAETNGWGQQAFNSAGSYGDLNGDGRPDFFDPAGSVNIDIDPLQQLNYSLWSIRAAGDVNGNGVDDVIITLAPQGPGYALDSNGLPTALQSALLDGSLFYVNPTSNTFSLAKAEGSFNDGWTSAGLKTPLNPYNRNQLYNLNSEDPSAYAPNLQNWFEPILSYKAGDLTSASTQNTTIPNSAQSYTAPAAAVSDNGQAYLVFSGKNTASSGAGLWMAYQNSSGNWTQSQLPIGNDASYLSPSAVFYKGKLVVAYTDVDRNLNVAWCEGDPGVSGAVWNSYQVIAESSQWNPTLVVEQGRLALYFPSNAGGTRQQTIRYLYSTDPLDKSANGNWGAKLNSTGDGYSGISGTLSDTGGSNLEITSPIAATTYQGRTVLAFRGYNGSLADANIWLATQVEDAATATVPGRNLSWVGFNTNLSDTNGVGLASDQSTLYLTSTTSAYGTFYQNPQPQMWSLNPKEGFAGNWLIDNMQTVSGPGYLPQSALQDNPLSTNKYNNGYGGAEIKISTTLVPYLANGRLYATWSGSTGTNPGANATDVEVADLSVTLNTARQKSLAGYSIDGNIDINGDGFKDILISDPSDPKQNVDNQYALFGGDYLNIASQVGTPGNDVLVGTSLADVIYTIQGADQVNSNGGADVIYTGAGDDTVSVADNAFIRIDAGSGFDVLRLQGRAGQSYDFRLNEPTPEYFAGTQLRDIELISSQDYGTNTLRFDAAAVNAINPDRVLFLTPDASDTINLTDEFQRNPSFDTSYSGGLWYAYAAGGGSVTTTNPTLIYVRVPDGSNALTWLASQVIVATESMAPLLASSSAPLLASSSATPAGRSVTIPSQSLVAGSNDFGNGLRITSYKSTPNSGTARFKISRNGDLSRSQLVSYVSSSQESSAGPGRDYTPVAGLLRLEAGQAEADITVPINVAEMVALRNGTLSMEVAELDDLGQKQLHLLLEVDHASNGIRPTLSGLNLQIDPASQTASIGFRADINKSARAEGLASTLNLNVLRRQSANSSTADLKNRAQKLVLSEGLLAKFDRDGSDNGQVELQFDLNAKVGSIQLLAKSGLQPLILSKLDPTRKPITVGVDLTTMSLDSLTVQTPPLGVVLNQTAVDFTVAADRHGRAKVFMDLTQTGGDLDLTEVINGVVIRKPNIHNLYYGIDDSGTLSALTYNARHRAGARFYDTDGNGIAEFVSLTFVDGGLGDKGPGGDGIIDDPSTAGVVKLTDVVLTTPDQHTLMAASASNAAAPASLVLRASLSRRAATVNHIGYVVLDATNETDTFESIFADLTSLKQRSQTLFSTLESTDITLAPGTALSREILLINSQSVRFFEVQNGTLDQLSSANDSRLRILKADPNFARNGLFSSSSGVGLSLSLVDGDQGLNALVGQEQGLAPVLDLTAFTADQPLVATLSLAREAAFDAVTGFYRSLDIQGTVWRDPFDVTKGTITPGEIGYSAAALKNMVDSLTGLQVGNRQTNTRSITLQESTYLAPIAQVNGNTFVAFASGNADGIAHFVTLGTNTFGLEDKFGGGDLDYDDQVISFNFKPVSGLVAA